MATLSKEICFKIKEARKAKGMNQSSLAREVGCQQSALSEFEAGKTTKLSLETVQKLSKFLGVPLEEEKLNHSSSSTSHSSLFTINSSLTHGYCPNCHCPSNVPYAVEGQIFFRPSRKIASPLGGKRCTQCGEVLEMSCPTCGAPLNDGACCGVCGSQYITPTLPDGVDATAYAKARQAEIASLRALQ